MNDPLLSLNGRFKGRGTNHEGQEFTGVFVANPAARNHGLYITFEATGDDGRSFHSESSLIGKNLVGQISLWVLSSNHPGIFERPLKDQSISDEGAFYLFGFGKRDERSTFREEIRIEIRTNSVKYVYFWGMPGGDFAERSECTMEYTSPAPS